MNYTYIVQCRDGSFYTGWTNNIEKRIEDHNNGKGAKYTKARRPVTLVYYEMFQTKEEAMRREYVIKQMRRAEKEQLIHGKGALFQQCALWSLKNKYIHDDEVANTSAHDEQMENFMCAEIFMFLIKERKF